MKLHFSIIGLLSLLIISFAPSVYAEDFCQYANTGFYKKAYCEMAEDEAMNDEVYETVAVQLGYKKSHKGLIGVLIAGGAIEKSEAQRTSCVALAYHMDQSNIGFNDIPKDLKEVCFSDAGEKSTPKDWLNLPPSLQEPLLAEWSNYLNRVRSAYQNEKILYQTQTQLKAQFESDERYWDGKLEDPVFSTDFDLMVDLNLIEIILFGERAEWSDDVFLWTFGDDDKKKDQDDSGTDSSGNDDQTASDESDENEDTTLPNSSDVVCVPQDPSAKNLPGDASGETCGNGIQDSDETCDDGKHCSDFSSCTIDLECLGKGDELCMPRSGDGCDQFCQQEMMTPITAPIPENSEKLMCVNPDAVTFKSLEDVRSAARASQNNSSSTASDPAACPPGTYPVKEYDTPEGETYAQDPAYPGPNIGGVMKQFPPSNRPECPPGENSYEIDFGDIEGSHMTSEKWASDGTQDVVEDALQGGAKALQALGFDVSDDFKINRCIPTELCVEPDAMKDFLLGENWKEDAAKAQIGLAIEAVACIEIKTENRPLAPYSQDDDCIDCHFSHSLDILDKILENNITPMENTMGSFASSNHWGPNLTFNVNAYAKGKVIEVEGVRGAAEKEEELVPLKCYDEAAKQASKIAIAKAKKQNVSEMKTEEEVMQECLKGIDSVINAQNNSTFIGAFSSLMGQWENRFKSMHSIITNMNMKKFGDIKPCQF